MGEIGLGLGSGVGVGIGIGGRRRLGRAGGGRLTLTLALPLTLTPTLPLGLPYPNPNPNRTPNQEGLYLVDLSALQFVLINAYKELEARVRSQQLEVAQLRRRADKRSADQAKVSLPPDPTPTP